jgi:hypothetical protein
MKDGKGDRSCATVHRRAQASEQKSTVGVVRFSLASLHCNDNSLRIQIKRMLVYLMR